MFFLFLIALFWWFWPVTAEHILLSTRSPHISSWYFGCHSKVKSCLLSLITLAAVSVQISDFCFCCFAAAYSLLARNNLVLSINWLILSQAWISISTESLTLPRHLLLSTRLIEVHLALQLWIGHTLSHASSEDHFLVIHLSYLRMISLVHILHRRTNIFRPTSLSAHAVEHNWSFCVSASFLVQIHNLLFLLHHLSGPHKILLLKWIYTLYVCWVLSSVTTFNHVFLTS